MRDLETQPNVPSRAIRVQREFSHRFQRTAQLYEGHVRGIAKIHRSRSNFIWNRAHVKKPIMTIPYKSSAKSMKNYLVDSLDLSSCDKDDTVLYGTHLPRRILKT